MPKVNGEGRVAVQVYITPLQIQELRELSALEDRPVSWLVRKAIDRMLEQADDCD